MNAIIYAIVAAVAAVAGGVLVKVLDYLRKKDANTEAHLAERRNKTPTIIAT